MNHHFEVAGLIKAHPFVQVQIDQLGLLESTAELLIPPPTRRFAKYFARGSTQPACVLMSNCSDCSLPLRSERARLISYRFTEEDVKLSSRGICSPT